MDIISAAILKNPTVKADSLLAILYTIMRRGTTEDDLEEEDQIIEDAKFEKKTKKELLKITTKVLPKFHNDNMIVKNKSSTFSKKLLTSFSLNTLKKSIGVLPIEEYKQRLDSFCEIYIKLLKSTDKRIVVNTIHLISK